MFPRQEGRPPCGTGIARQVVEKPHCDKADRHGQEDKGRKGVYETANHK